MDKRLHDRERKEERKKERKKDNKLSTAYEKEPYTVLSRHGAHVFLQSSQAVQYRRNLQNVNPFYFPHQKDQAEIEEPELATSPPSPAPETEVHSPAVPVQMLQRPPAVTMQPLTTNSEPPGGPVQRHEQPPAVRRLERVTR